MPDVDAAVDWLTRRSRATQLILVGLVALLLGYQAIRFGGRDPGSELAYVGGALFLLGQLVGFTGLALLAYRLLTE
ncbi:hypothetical protein [Halobaculum magnesiiphilum]|uniref:Uncharacterized protein n=1 Tax=Halobaculum magnesiiphilum TaxID=1017351 RepID=A0A8T8WES0_9EURY|nr:hypothetical protein [Halobaculum magnesiiphilum]QZP38372.1 hypothetical protein K6T50_04305 [Halobaculum magnesiiphilum]